MNTITKQSSVGVYCHKPINNGIGIHHNEHDGKCPEPTCKIPTKHNHWTSEGCLACIKDYLEKIFPLEKTINNIKINSEDLSTNTKQFLLMVSNLTPAIAMSEILKPFHVDSFVASPLAVSAMHLTNRGTEKLHKLAFTALSSIGVITLQKFMSLPRVLIRPIMALAVFFIEKNGKEKHVHIEACDHKHEPKSEHDEKHIHSANNKAEWIKLLKLQGQINTVPSIINFGVNKLKELNESNDGMIKKFFSHVGISALQILGLSVGFIGVGKLIDRLLLQFNIVNSEEALAMRAEGAICTCCGAPVCVAETASESAAISVGG